MSHKATPPVPPSPPSEPRVPEIPTTDIGLLALIAAMLRRPREGRDDDIAVQDAAALYKRAKAYIESLPQ